MEVVPYHRVFCIILWYISLGGPVGKFPTNFFPHAHKIEQQKNVLGRQANLRESSKSKELAELRLQVLVVVITSDACESKKEIMRLRE